MKHLKIVCTNDSKAYFNTYRELVMVDNTDYTDVAAIVLCEANINLIEDINNKGFNIPIFVISNNKIDYKNVVVYKIDEVSNLSEDIEKEALKYEEKLLPPFFEALSIYADIKNTQFACPGHKRGKYFLKHPAGRYFHDFYGENIFRSDVCSSDVTLGDLLIHEGKALDAQQYAAKVFNADKTYFVMNGTSTSNAVAINAVIAPGDLVLFDRNNHKSVYNAALVQAGGIPVYLETARNPFGFIGGIDEHCFDEEYIRSGIAKVAPEKASDKRPFRLAIIQLGTYDGTIYNARWIVDKIGHLCDYILFDSAWVGYEQFIPMMRDSSPLLLNLNANDPGILVTQSVHKQQAGFSQASQIHKKDAHIRGQRRYIDHKRFNNSYMMYASTSPFYPLYASLDINAKMQEGDAGKRLWEECIKVGIEARKEIINKCSIIKTFIPPVVKGNPWEEYDTNEIAHNIEFFKFIPGEKWHSFEGYGENQYFLDPNKLLITTPGINVEEGIYEDFGIPSTILINYLREYGIIPEKSDLNSILFLLTPAETKESMDDLVNKLIKFEAYIKNDAPVSEVLPNIYSKNKERYKDYTIRMLCQEMHNFYKENDAKKYQKLLFRASTFLQDENKIMTPQEARWALIRNEAKLVAIENIVGEIALEGALPYPPGILCIVPGERWTKEAQKYFLILQDALNKFPGFNTEIQGVYLEKENGLIKAYGYVYDKKNNI